MFQSMTDLIDIELGKACASEVCSSSHELQSLAVFALDRAAYRILPQQCRVTWKKRDNDAARWKM